MGRVHLKKYNKELENIVDFVNITYNIDLKSASRKAIYVKGRTLYFALALKTTKASLENIGSYVNRDHSTVSYAKDRLIPEMLEGNCFMKQSYNKFLINLSNGIYSIRNRAKNYYDALETIKSLKATVKSLKACSSVNFSNKKNKNELLYQSLSDSQKAVYDDRCELILMSFNWKESKESDKYEQINCEA